MILGQREQIFDGELFAAGLMRALRGVVRVSVGPAGSSGVSTGWLVTPQLVMLPGYAIEGRDGQPTAQDGIRVEAIGKDKAAWIEAVKAEPELLGPGLLESPGSTSAVALLRLPTAHPDCQLTLGFESPQPGDFLCLLH